MLSTPTGHFPNGFVTVPKLKCCKIHDFRHVNSWRSAVNVFLEAANGLLFARTGCERCDRCDRRTANGSVKSHDACARMLRTDFANGLCERTAIVHANRPATNGLRSGNTKFNRLRRAIRVLRVALTPNIDMQL